MIMLLCRVLLTSHLPCALFGVLWLAVARIYWFASLVLMMMGEIMMVSVQRTAV